MRVPAPSRAKLLAALLLLATLARPVGAQSVPVLRIGLEESAGRSTVATSGSGVIADATGRVLAETSPLEAWQVRHEPNGGISLMSQTRRVVVNDLPARVVSRGRSGSVPLVFGANRWYRGELELRPDARGLTVINVVSLEQYLYGVVPVEMNARWPTETLKAQAVAARTYALAKMGQFASRGYDLRPTTENQVYRGASVETLGSNLAVDQTLGQVLTYDGRIIAAYFHSCSGGYTETSAAVWGEPRPYLQAVPDYDQQSPRYLWQKQVSASSVRAGLSREGLEVGQLVRLEVLERSYSGRVARVRVVGTSGSRETSGDVVRRAAGLYSTLFSVLGFGGSVPATFAFAGRGHGHGLGLSQWGAKTLGEQGYSYAQILAHYYPSTQLSSVGWASAQP